MWLICKEGFFSVVSKTSICEVTIRAREKAQLEDLIGRYRDLKSYIIDHKRGTDYQYRITVPKSVWKSVMVQMVNDIDYSNFKDHCHKHCSGQYVSLLHKIWNAVADCYGSKLHGHRLSDKKQREEYSRQFLAVHASKEQE